MDKNGDGRIMMSEIGHIYSKIQSHLITETGPGTKSTRGFEDSVSKHIAEVRRRYAFYNSDYLLQIEGGISFSSNYVKTIQLIQILKNESF